MYDSKHFFYYFYSLSALSVCAFCTDMPEELITYSAQNTKIYKKVNKTMKQGRAHEEE